MEILAISGSLRAGSTNSALIRAFADLAPRGVRVRICTDLPRLPAFSPDREGPATPRAVLGFAARVARAEALVISSPEYVHAIPGALKNAIDWLVSREELVSKPIALLHASHRGEDVLADLRRVLTTVSANFLPQVFAQFALMKKSPDEIAGLFREAEARAAMATFWADLIAGVEAQRSGVIRLSSPSFRT